MSTLFFDLETTGVDDSSSITCGVVADQDGNTTWYHSGYGRTLSKKYGVKLLDQLCTARTVVSFNGAQFDFRQLYLLTRDPRAKTLAADHADMMLQFAADHGYFCSMASLADGTFPGETNKTNTGGWAATAWFSGEAEQVAEYCEQDTLVLRRLYLAAQERGVLSRVTKAGRQRQWVVKTEPTAPTVLSARENLAKYAANPPDTSWMTDGGPDIAGTLAWTTSL